MNSLHPQKNYSTTELRNIQKKFLQLGKRTNVSVQSVKRRRYLHVKLNSSEGMSSKYYIIYFSLAYLLSSCVVLR